jgi:ProP effector
MKHDVTAVLAHLVERFPATFVLEKYRPHRPLKVGITTDIRGRCPEFKSRQLGLAINFYTSRLMYLQSMVEGTARIDLDGNPAGEVTARDAAYAAARVANIMAQRAAVAAKVEERKARASASKPYLKPDLSLRRERPMPAENMEKSAPEPAIIEFPPVQPASMVPLPSTGRVSLREKPVLRLPAFRRASP